MRICLYSDELSQLRKDGGLLSSSVFRWPARRLALAGTLSVVLISSGCDPKPPPMEDLGTILEIAPVIAGSEEPYEFPEDVARAVEEAERKQAEAESER